MSLRAARGYALLWVLVIVAVLAGLAAAAAPYMNTSIAEKRAVDSTAQVLREIGVGLNAMELAVARKFPGRPSELANVIVNGSMMSCWSSSYGTTDPNSWSSGGGPFITFMIPTDGLWTPMGRLADSVENRASNHSDFLWLDIPGVRTELVEMLDLSVDGVISGTADTVQYHAPVNDTTTVRYRVTPRELARC